MDYHTFTTPIYPQLKDKVAIITGGSKGIGLGIAHALLSQHIKVAITARSQGDLDQAKAQLSKEFPADHILCFQNDVRDLEAFQSVIDSITSQWGNIDYVIANAGVGHFAPIDQLGPEAWKDTIDINLTGVYNTVHATLDTLKKSQGYIITLASLAGTNFFANGAAYNASKFGLVGFSQAIMLDLRKYGIKVSTIMPGSVTSYFNGHVPNEDDAWKIQPEDIGKMVVDLITMHPRTLPSKVEVRPSFPK